MQTQPAGQVYNPPQSQPIYSQQGMSQLSGRTPLMVQQMQPQFQQQMPSVNSGVPQQNMPSGNYGASQQNMSQFYSQPPAMMHPQQMQPTSYSYPQQQSMSQMCHNRSSLC